MTIYASPNTHVKVALSELHNCVREHVAVITHIACLIFFFFFSHLTDASFYFYPDVFYFAAVLQ